MPLYQYDCTKCGGRVELLRQIDDRDLPLHCKTCGGPCCRNHFPGGHVGPTAQANGPSDSEEKLAGGTAIAIETPGRVTMEDCTFTNFGQGIVAHPDAKVSLTRTKFRNVKVPIKRRGK